MFSRFAIIVAALLLAACSGRGNSTASLCQGDVVCGHFDISKAKESSPIFFATVSPSPIYRLCVEQGSVILQTIESDGNAHSIGGEIRAGNCTEVVFAEKIYIIGNTANGHSSGFYYRVP